MMTLQERQELKQVMKEAVKEALEEDRQAQKSRFTEAFANSVDRFGAATDRLIAEGIKFRESR